MPHWHPTRCDGCGALTLSFTDMAEQWDEAKLKSIPPAFFSEPFKAPRLAWAKVVLQITFGPTATTNIEQPKK